MNRINSFSGPRVQAPSTPATSSAARTGFGSLLQTGTQAAPPRPGDPLMASGGQVVASALATVGASPHGGIVNSFLSAVGRGPISEDGTGGAAQGATAQPGTEEAQAQQQLLEIAELTAASLSNSILHMGNRMKVDLERE